MRPNAAWSLAITFTLTACAPNDTELAQPASEPQTISTKIAQELVSSTEVDTTTDGRSESIPAETSASAEQGTSLNSSNTNAAEIAKVEQNVAADKLVSQMGFAEKDEPASGFQNSDKTNYTPRCRKTQHAKPHEPRPTEKPVNVINSFCESVSNRLASVSMKSCLAARLETTGCESHNGQPITVREFAPLDHVSAKGRILLVGGTHGDELTSVSVIFRWIETLNNHHSGLFHWRVIPVLNPDGLLKRAAQRTNENGVDINRNLPSLDWEQNALDYWVNKSNRDPRKYPGAKPNSEPETQLLVDEIMLFKPDAIIAVHAPYGVVDFDAHQLKSAPKSLGKLHLNLLGTYPGSLGNYAGMNLNIPVITLELPHSWVMPSQRESELIWQDTISWLKKNVPADTAGNAD